LNIRDPKNGAAVRKIPYPYQAMLSVCSDLDETPDRNVFFETAKFLNTPAMTAIGPGLDLEVGNTIYFDMPAPQFSFWNTDDRGRGMIFDSIRSGHIDCLHSFGDHARTRRHAERAIGALARNNCRMEVWIDHATAPSNFGADIMQGSGDLPASGIYHADLSCGFGIQFVWLGRVTSVIGQDSAWSLKGIWSRELPLRSLLTIARESAKRLCAAIGGVKYGMHRQNRLMRAVRLRDGRSVFEFMRSNPNGRGVGCGATAAGIPEILRPAVLDRMVRRHAIGILYTHLGKRIVPQTIFPPQAVRAFATLATYYRDRKILVAATHRILKYRRAIGDLVLASEPDDGCRTLRLDSRYPRDLEGLTVYTENPEKTRLVLNGQPVLQTVQNPPDESGRPSISLPWKKLEYPL
jgi:hypothetical protein